MNSLTVMKVRLSNMVKNSDFFWYGIFEPGIYLPGEFGIRIEEQILIEEDEPHVLHSFPKHLISIN